MILIFLWFWARGPWGPWDPPFFESFMKTIATIILNRNLPDPTDKLYEHLTKYDGEETDVYVLEAGSDKKNLSQYCTWHANSDEIIKDLSRSSPLMTQQLLIPNSEVVRLRLKFKNFSKKLKRPNFIIVDKENDFADIIKSIPQNYCKTAENNSFYISISLK